MKRLLVLLLLAFIGVNAHAENVLHIYNWTDYIPPETLKRFEASCGCRVVYDTYGSNEEMLAKLTAGARGYDVIVPTDYAVSTLIRQEVLLPLDRSKLPNLKNIDPAFLDREFDPGNRYSVPYAYGMGVIGYSEAKMKELAVPTDTWAAMFEPKYLQKLKGRVTVLDDERELLGAALKYLGYSVNDTDKTHWKQAVDLILRAKPYWAAFNNTSYIRQLSVGDLWLAHGYSMDMFQARVAADEAGRGIKIGYTLPREGGVIGLDNMVIHKDTSHLDLAHRFINFMLDGKNAADLTNTLGSGNPNQAARRYIRPELAQNPGIFPDAIVLTRLEHIRDLPSRQRQSLSRLWTEIKLK